MFPRREAFGAVMRRCRCWVLLMGLAVPAFGAAAQDEPPEAAPEPAPLADIVTREQASDPWAVPAVSLRCTSFYISAAAMEKEERPAIADQYEANAEVFLSRAIALSRQNKDRLIAQMTRLSRMYYLLSQAALEGKGDPMDHPLLRADFDFCSRLARQS